MSLDELTHAVRTSTSPPSSDAETASKVRLLEQSGRVLVLEDMVYLHPRDVTQAVLRVLPGVPSKVYGMSNAELEQLKTEFDSMTKHYETARRRAESRSRTIVSSGLLVLCLQLAAFVRLTYYEFSWDVMEPLSYFVGLRQAPSPCTSTICGTVATFRTKPGNPRSRVSTPSARYTGKGSTSIDTAPSRDVFVGRRESKKVAANRDASPSTTHHRRRSSVV